jgi:hypothetical protein
VLGIAELLAQQLHVAGQLGHPRSDPFRQFHPAPQRHYRTNKDGH